MNVGGNLTWVPSGNAAPILANGSPNPSYVASCNPDSGSFSPSTQCTGFGRIRGETDYQVPRTFLVTVGLQF